MFQNLPKVARRVEYPIHDSMLLFGQGGEQTQASRNLPQLPDEILLDLQLELQTVQLEHPPVYLLLSEGMQETQETAQIPR